MITCKIVAYLLSLAAGYWVLTLADKQKNSVRTVGKWVGWIIMVVSICGMLCSASACHKYGCQKAGHGPGKWECPKNVPGKWERQKGGPGVWGGKDMGGSDKMRYPGKKGGRKTMEEKEQAEETE